MHRLDSFPQSGPWWHPEITRCSVLSWTLPPRGGTSANELSRGRDILRVRSADLSKRGSKMTMLLLLMISWWWWWWKWKLALTKEWNLPRTGYNFSNNLFLAHFLVFFHVIHLHLQILILSDQCWCSLDVKTEECCQFKTAWEAICRRIYWCRLYWSQVCIVQW